MSVNGAISYAQIENSWLQVLKFVKIREFYEIFKIRKNSFFVSLERWLIFSVVWLLFRFYSRDKRTLVSGKRVFAVIEVYAVDRYCINIENIWVIL